MKKPKRLNRTTSINDVINKAIDPVLKKRGFANRDIITNWQNFAPAPYDKVAMPERLEWKRGKAGEEGATLYLRCAPSHALALSHESTKIAATINRYFGYILIGKIKLSLEPFSPHSSKIIDKQKTPSKEVIKKINQEISDVKDNELKQALYQLGINLKSNK